MENAEQKLQGGLTILCPPFQPCMKNDATPLVELEVNLQDIENARACVYIIGQTEELFFSVRDAQEVSWQFV